MSLSKETRERHAKWNDFLNCHVDFWLKNSEKHTKEHCARVLLYCLLIAERMQLTEEEIEILCMAAVFHDSRRQDDWYDVGHGKRAAEHYREYCGKSEIKFDQRCYDIMYYHDRDDQSGIFAIKKRSSTADELLLYKIFKDSDALDRFRLGSDGLDVSYLRTDEAKSLYSYAKHIWETYFAENSEKRINKNDLWTQIYREKED